MLNRTLLDLSYHNNLYNFEYLFKDLKSFLEKSDLVVGNLETPITRNEDQIQHQEYSFTSPLSFALAVKNAGIHLVSIANNHCLDNGILGAKETIDSLDEINLEHIGITYKKEKIHTWEYKNIKVGFLSYTYGTNAFSNNVYIKDSDIKINLFQHQELHNPILRQVYHNDFILCKILRKIFKIFHLFQFHKPIYERTESSIKERKKIKSDIACLKKNNCDYIVMCMHAGGQYNEKPLTQTRKLAKFLHNNGIDLIVGNHEHVIQQIEFLKKGLVAYSLGNFISTNGVIEKPFDKMGDYSILLHAYLKKDKSNQIIPRFSFTILKIIKHKNSVKVSLLKDEIDREKDIKNKQKLILDNKKIVKMITNNINNNIQDEYWLN